MKTILRFGSFCCLIITMFLVAACKKDNTTDETNPPSGNTTVTTTLVGRVYDTAKNPLSGATVSLNGVSATTDLTGIFLFKDVTVDSKRMFIKITKSGYLDQSVGCHPSAGNVTYVNSMMLTAGGSYSITSATGGTVTDASGASVDFPANAFVNADGTAYTGTVTVKLTYLNPDDSLVRLKTPGRDLRATNAQGTEQVLVSFGMLNVELLSAANAKLQLKTGKTATLHMPVSAGQASTAPASMPMWHFDESTGIWKEEGTCAKTGSQYVATVSHFTWWNCDQPYPLATITGRVKDCSGFGVANCSIYYGCVSSDNLGNFTDDAPAGYPVSFPVWAYAPSGGTQSQVEYVPILTVGQVYTVPDLQLGNLSASGIITGSLVNCNTLAQPGLAIITCAATNYYDYQYAPNGNFSFVVAPNQTYKVTCANAGQYGQATAQVSAPSCTPINIGNIPVCNNISGIGSNFTATITSPLLGTQTLGAHIDNCNVIQTTINNAWQISLTGNDTINNATALMLMPVDNYVAGSYPWNNNTSSIYLTGNLNGIPVVIQPDGPSSGTNVIIAAGAVGSNLRASFSGNVIITSSSFPGTQIPGTITGSYDVYRNH